ncbi:hypothetical protein JCM19298_1929 [Nonlabens ulvanivorans]|nr:hypothetical protein JCM19298_1929 [Nonlabens ulvanivorans]
MAANSYINPKARRKKEIINVDSLFNDLKSGHVSALSRAITLVESTASGDSVSRKRL